MSEGKNGNQYGMVGRESRKQMEMNEAKNHRKAYEAGISSMVTVDI